MQIAAELEQTQALPADGRRADRANIHATGGIRRQSVTTPVTVHDMSTTGFRITLSAPVPVGSVVWLKLPGMESLQAQVMWLDGLVAGCALAAPLHPAVFTHLVARLGAQGSA